MNAPPATAPPVAGPPRGARVFISYAHADAALHAALVSHLAALRREGWIATWDDREILPGEDWAQAIDERLNAADVILLFVSAAFIDSDYCSGIELTRAMQRLNDPADRPAVIPVILDDCDWHSQPFGKLQALPRGGKPVSDWKTPAKHHTAVAQGLRERLRRMVDADRSPWARLTGRLRDPRWWEQPQVWGAALAMALLVTGTAGGLWVWSQALDRDLGGAIKALRSGRYADAAAQVARICQGPSGGWPVCRSARIKVQALQGLTEPETLKGDAMERLAEQVQSLRQQHPDDADYAYLSGALALRSRAAAADATQVRQAVGEVQQALALAGGAVKYPEAAFYLAGLALADQRFTEALRLLDAALSGKSKPAAYLGARAYARLRSGDLPGAVDDERDAAEAGAIAARIELAALLWRGPANLPEEARLAEARRHLDQAVAALDAPQHPPGDARPWQYELGEGQDPLTLETWAEKRCLAQLLRRAPRDCRARRRSCRAPCRRAVAPRPG